MITVEGLQFRYRGSSPLVIADLTHEFREGQITVVTGPSGCGKSTLLYLLGLMLTPSAGCIRWSDGVDVSSLPDPERSRLRAEFVGFVFQDALLDPSRSIVDNVAEGGLYAGMERADTAANARRLLKHFGVSHRADHRPGEISGGQAQRVALCRALVKEPQLILADEPSGNLDEVNANVVWDALSAAASAGRTVVVATHDPHRVARAHALIAL